MDRYSRLVAWLKVLLPLAALSLFSTLFLISRGIDTEAVIPFAEKEIEERMRDQQVTGPFFSGTTPQGDEIMVTATVARPGGFGAPAEATDLKARIRMADGSQLDLVADTGTVALDKDRASFIGNVEIASTNGLVVRTDRLNAALSGIDADSPGQIKGIGPIGVFTAGVMKIRAKNENGPVHMVFNKGVKLIYTPQQAER